MNRREKAYKVKGADKAKKISMHVDEAIKEELDEHNLSKEYSNQVNPSAPAVRAIFLITPSPHEVEEFTDTYTKFASESHYNRTLWYKLPKISPDGKIVEMDFETEQDLKRFQQRLSNRGLSAHLKVSQRSPSH